MLLRFVMIYICFISEKHNELHFNHSWSKTEKHNISRHNDTGAEKQEQAAIMLLCVKSKDDCTSNIDKYREENM